MLKRAPSPRNNSTRLQLITLEEKVTPTASINANIFASAGDAGGQPLVKVFDNSGNLKAQFLAYDASFTGGVRVAVGDTNNDGFFDVITAPGPGGGPHVKIFDGQAIDSGSSNPPILQQFFAFDPNFTGGVSVAAGDLDGNGIADVVTGAGPGGGPHIKAYSGNNPGNLLINFFGYDPNFTGGVNVTAGDLGGDQTTDELATAPGNGGGSHIKIYKFRGDPNPQLLSQFFAFGGTYLGGANVSTGYFTNNRDFQNFEYTDLIVGTGPNINNQVKVYRLLDAIDPNWTYFEATSFSPYANGNTGGVRVGSVRIGSQDNFITVPGPGSPSHTIAFNSTSIGDEATFTPSSNFALFPFATSFTGGAFVS